MPWPHRVPTPLVVVVVVVVLVTIPVAGRATLADLTTVVGTWLALFWQLRGSQRAGSGQSATG